VKEIALGFPWLSRSYIDAQNSSRQNYRADDSRRPE
jgi:hypothetical protein